MCLLRCVASRRVASHPNGFRLCLYSVTPRRVARALLPKSIAPGLSDLLQVYEGSAPQIALSSPTPHVSIYVAGHLCIGSCT
eukprot:scaffold608_cov248-Pinguiococcus_pyrenoidosus.AAC.1